MSSNPECELLRRSCKPYIIVIAFLSLVGCIVGFSLAFTKYTNDYNAWNALYLAEISITPSDGSSGSSSLEEYTHKQKHDASTKVLICIVVASVCSLVLVFVSIHYGCKVCKEKYEGAPLLSQTAIPTPSNANTDV